MKVGSYVLTLPRRVSNRNHFTASSKLICNILLLLFGTESYSGLHFSQTLSKLPAIYCSCSAQFFVFVASSLLICLYGHLVNHVKV